MTKTNTPARVQRVSRNTQGRDYIVGDIHGHFRKLQLALDAIGFDPAKDRLFSVGDLVDRGPDCDEVLDWVARPWFFPVQGNHETMAIRWPKGKHVDGEFVRDMDAGNYMANGGGWNIGNPEHLQKEISDALAALPIAIELETAAGPVGIVHADVFGCSWPGFLAMLEYVPKSAKHREIQQDVIDHAQWSRGRIDYRDESMVTGVRAVVVGHTPQSAGPVILGNTHFIDTMGWRGREFTLLDAETLVPTAALVPGEAL